MIKNNLYLNEKKIKVIDNFLQEKDLKEILEIALKKDAKNEFNVYHNEINESGIITSSIEPSLISRLHKNYHSKAFSILKEINKEKAELYDYSDFTIIITGKNSKFPIHDDTPNKLLSGVIYLYPEKNFGTFFYDNNKGKNKLDAEWQVNRGVFFSRKERETWHSYHSDGVNNRVALVYNLMTKRIKEVYKIEKKNYFLGMLRWKMNPYLFRYFKFYF
tara:strand:+ start:1810 stop:2463 length:654 start_codon:yes stop_codon:yes gene_type:complete